MAEVERSVTIDEKEFCEAADEATKSLASVREAIQSLLTKQQNTSDLDTKDGISLLSLKHHLLLSYMQSLVLLSSHRILGHSLEERKPVSQPFRSLNRDARGDGAGDLVDSMLEGRIVLEKIKALETRMRYQIDKLVRVAEEAPKSADAVADDPLAFRPNPQNLVDGEGEASDAEDMAENDKTGVYRPPKLAPMPYTDGKTKKDKANRVHVPSALSSLVHLDPANPHVESSTGLGSMPSLSSGRARELERMTNFEEENMTRLVMNKKEAKRRKRDEADIALGGRGGRRGHAGGGGLADEFGDVLRAVGAGSRRSGLVPDAYDELRGKKKMTAYERSLARRGERDEEEVSDGPRPRKRSRFEKAVKAMKKRRK